MKEDINPFDLGTPAQPRYVTINSDTRKEDILNDFDTRFPTENLPRHVVKEFIAVVFTQQEERHKAEMREVLEEIYQERHTTNGEPESWYRGMDNAIDIINKKLESL